MRCDVIVLGAGLAGLVAARDLTSAGVDVLILEARGRPGGRVIQHTLPDHRQVQLGGEVIGPSHTSYQGLVEELGLTIEPSFTDIPGLDTSLLVDGKHIVEGFDWLGSADRDLYRRCEDEFKKLVASVDVNDPWSHPHAQQLDALSVADWLRSQGATPQVIRARKLAMLALAAESPERTSLLSDLRKEASTGDGGFYNYDVWESYRVAEGSGAVPLRLAAELPGRIRYETPVSSVSLSPGNCVVTAHTGETFFSSAVVSAVPVGPLRDIHIDGLSKERKASLRAQRHAIVSKVVAVYPQSFWEENGQNGSAYFESHIMGGTWSQRDGILSALIPPERHALFEATDPSLVQKQLIDEFAEAFGEEAKNPDRLFIRRWGTDTWTKGYITAWRPGDVMAVGPLHGTHEPPLYLCGSDQWVCGYMEGAVRTGKDAAAHALKNG
jgi:monoamine oxidase